MTGFQTPFPIAMRSSHLTAGRSFCAEVSASKLLSERRAQTPRDITRRKRDEPASGGYTVVLHFIRLSIPRRDCRLPTTWAFPRGGAITWPQKRRLRIA
jgi:hypothetical protein